MAQRSTSRVIDGFQMGTKAVAIAGFLVTFQWFLILILHAVGNANEILDYELGAFSAVGFLAIGLGCLATFAIGSVSFIRIAVLSVAVGLSLTPLLLNSTVVRSGDVLFELFFISLVAVPAFVGLWNGWYQLLNAAICLIAATAFWWTEKNWASMHSIFLLFLASMLSVFVVLYRRVDGQQSFFNLLDQGVENDQGRANSRLLQLSWNYLILHAGLLLLLMFLDVALFGATTQLAIYCKVYGLVVVILSGMLLAVLDSHRTSVILAVLSVLIALTISVARSAYGDLPNLYFAVPLVYLMFLATSLPWPLRRGVSVVWAILLGDILVKVFTAYSATQPAFATLGNTLRQFRGEISLVVLGAFSTSGIAISRAYWGQRPGVVRRSESGLIRLEPNDLWEGESPATSCSWLAKLVERESQRRLLLVEFVFGVVSCLTSSKLLLTINPDFWHALVLSWTIFLCLWGVLFLSYHRAVRRQYYWSFGVLVKLVMLLWPSILLLVSKPSGALWICWPIAVVLGITATPWGRKEFSALVLVGLVVGFEIIRQLKLGTLGLFGFCLIMLLSCWWNLLGRRQLVQLLALKNAGKRFSDCDSEFEILRSLAHAAVGVVNGHFAIIRDGVSRTHTLRFGDTSSFEVNEQLSWPQKEESEYREQTTTAISRVRWDEDAFFQATSYAAERSVSGLELALRRFEGGEPKLIWVVTGSSLIQSMFGEDQVTLNAILGMAQSRLDRIQAELDIKEHAREFAEKLLQREYELGALVHEINNTVQDLTLLCERILEQALRRKDSSQGLAEGEVDLVDEIRRIEGIARSVATVVSDAKRKRELEKMQDLRPRELVEVGQVVKELMEFAILKAERKRISIGKFEVPTERLWVRVSVREHLETILRNLLNNAITYSESGATVEVKLRWDLSQVHIDVSDNGPGLSPTECSSIFEIGFRGRQAEDVRGGLGLGLSVSRRVAESAGGTLSVYSAGPGLGSTFTLTLPRQPEPRFQAVGPGWVLLVDDEPGIIEFYSRLIRSLGLSPRAASSVRDATDLLELYGRPVLVITDIHLGGSSGLELVSSIRENFGNTPPIIVVSGLPDSDLSERARRIGATDFIQKPVSQRVLFARIQSLMPEAV